MYRPFSPKHFLAALPKTKRKIAVLDRTKEPGSSGEPLCKDVLLELGLAYSIDEINHMPKVIGGRYGLSSKEFTPSIVGRIFAELNKNKPKNNFTIVINTVASSEKIMQFGLIT